MYPESQRPRLKVEFFLQITALMLPLLLTSVAAFVGCISYEKVLASLGFSVKLPAFAYTASALVAMSNPVLAIFAAVTLPVRLYLLSLLS